MKFLTYVSFFVCYFHFDFASFFIKLFHVLMIKDCGVMGFLLGFGVRVGKGRRVV